MLFIFSLKTASILAFGASYLISEAIIYANRCLVAKTKVQRSETRSPNPNPTRTFILDLNRNRVLINTPIYNHKYYTHLQQPHLSFNLNPIHVLACIQPWGQFLWNFMKFHETLETTLLLFGSIVLNIQAYCCIKDAI